MCSTSPTRIGLGAVEQVPLIDPQATWPYLRECIDRIGKFFKLFSFSSFALIFQFNMFLDMQMLGFCCTMGLDENLTFSGGVGTCLGRLLIEMCLKMSKNTSLSGFTCTRVSACVRSLYSCVRILYSCIHRISSCVWSVLSVYINAWSNLHMQTRAYIRTLALRNPIFTVLAPFSLIFSPNCNFNALFSSFCKLRLHSQVGVTPIILLHGTGSWLRRLGVTYVLHTPDTPTTTF